MRETEQRRLAQCLMLAALLGCPGILIADESVEAAAEEKAATSLPEAPSVDLDEPVSEQEFLESAATRRASQSGKLVEAADLYTPEPLDEPIYSEALPEIDLPHALVLLGAKVPAGTSTRLAWSPSQSFEGIAVPTPVLVVNGAADGPTLCLTAAIHGDELNGIEIVRRVLYNLDPAELSGAVVGVPIVNLQGFQRSSRYMTDRRDLNRFFPGNPEGSSASRIAHSFFNDVITHCDALVDLHTGSFHRTNLPQLRADLHNPAVLELSHGFGSTVVLHSSGTQGTLRRAAVDYGIPALTLEAGAPMRLEEDSVQEGVKGIETLMSRMKMLERFKLWGNPEPVYYQSNWVRADQGGILFSAVSLGQSVDVGELLGTVTDPITNVRTDIVAPDAGKVLGMALNQVVLPGFAAYRIGIQASDELEDLQDNEASAGDDDMAAYGEEPTLEDTVAE